MKVKIFSNADMRELEKDINKYLEKVTPVNFVDIKMSTCDHSCEAMVITRTEVE